MSNFALRLPKELQDRAAAQAKASGVSLNQYIATMLAYRVGAMDEVQRMFAIRGARAQPGRAREILSRAGRGNTPVTGDEVEE